MNLAKNWYFVQVGPLDPRAQKLPLPDDLMGELIAATSSRTKSATRSASSTT